MEQSNQEQTTEDDVASSDSFNSYCSKLQEANRLEKAATEASTQASHFEDIITWVALSIDQQGAEALINQLQANAATCAAKADSLVIHNPQFLSC